MPFRIEHNGDELVVSASIGRAALDGLTKAEALDYIREQILDHIGWQRIVDLLPLIAEPRRSRIAHVGQFIHEVLTRDKTGAASALTDMVSDGTITESERTAILGSFIE